MKNYRFRIKPYEHQRVALGASWDKEEFAYFMEMGTGKSKVLIDNISILYDNGHIDSALIIAPKEFIKIGLNSKYQNTSPTIYTIESLRGHQTPIRKKKKS